MWFLVLGCVNTLGWCIIAHRWSTASKCHQYQQVAASVMWKLAVVQSKHCSQYVKAAMGLVASTGRWICERDTGAFICYPDPRWNKVNTVVATKTANVCWATDVCPCSIWHWSNGTTAPSKIQWWTRFPDDPCPKSHREPAAEQSEGFGCEGPHKPQN